MKKTKSQYSDFKIQRISEERLKKYFSKNFVSKLIIKKHLQKDNIILNPFLKFSEKEIFEIYLKISKKYKMSNWIEILNILVKKLFKEKISFEIKKKNDWKIILSRYKGILIFEGKFGNGKIKKIQNFFGYKFIKYFFPKFLEVLFFFLQEKRKKLEKKIFNWDLDITIDYEIESKNLKFNKIEENKYIFDDEKTMKCEISKIEEFPKNDKNDKISKNGKISKFENISKFDKEVNIKKEVNSVKEVNFENLTENEKIEKDVKNLIMLLTKKKSDFKILEIKNKKKIKEEVYYKFKNFENCQNLTSEELFKKIIKIFYFDDLKFNFITKIEKIKGIFVIPRLKIKMSLKLNFLKKEKNSKIFCFLIFFRKNFPKIFLQFENLFDFLKIEIFEKKNFNFEIFEIFQKKNEKYCILKNKEISNFHLFKDIKKKIFNDFLNEDLKNFEISKNGNFQNFFNFFLKIDFIFKFEISYQNNLFCIQYEIISKKEKKKKIL